MTDDIIGSTEETEEINLDIKNASFEESSILPVINIPDEVDIFIENFALSDTTREVGGVLVGSLEYDKEKNPVIKIVGAIPAKHTEASLSSVKFTAQSWEYINTVMEDEYPDYKIVGWFHTHPGFGIFLSSWDLFIQRHFFNLSWQIAYVVDPVNMRKGFFGWQDGEIVKIYEDMWEDRTEANILKASNEYKENAISWRRISIIFLIGIILIAGMVFATFKGNALKSYKKSGIKTEFKKQKNLFFNAPDIFKSEKDKSDKSKKNNK